MRINVEINLDNKMNVNIGKFKNCAKRGDKYD